MTDDAATASHPTDEVAEAVIPPPTLTTELLDRYEQLLDRADQQHKQQIRAAVEVLHAGERLREHAADTSESDLAVRTSALDAAGSLVAQVIGAVANAQLEGDESDDELGMFYKLLRDVWLVTAKAGEEYLRTGAVDVDLDELVPVPGSAEAVHASSAIAKWFELAQDADNLLSVWLHDPDSLDADDVGRWQERHTKLGHEAADRLRATLAGTLPSRDELMGELRNAAELMDGVDWSDQVPSWQQRRHDWTERFHQLEANMEGRVPEPREIGVRGVSSATLRDLFEEVGTRGEAMRGHPGGLLVEEARGLIRAVPDHLLDQRPGDPRVRPALDEDDGLREAIRCDAAIPHNPHPWAGMFGGRLLKCDGGWQQCDDAVTQPTHRGHFWGWRGEGPHWCGSVTTPAEVSRRDPGGAITIVDKSYAGGDNPAGL